MPRNCRADCPGHARCHAHAKKTGKPCGRGPVPGGTVCSMHGGKAPQVKAAAERRLEVAEIGRKLERLGVAIEVNPLDALQHSVFEAAGNVAFLRERVQDGGETPSAAWLAHYDAERERLAKFAKMAVDAGVSERLVRLEEAKAEALVRAIKTAVARAGLSPEQQQLVLVETARELKDLKA